LVYEDRWILAVDKPAGMPTQPGRSGRETARHTGDDLFGIVKRGRAYVGMLHRLDQPASGLVLFSVHPAANPPLAAAFRTHAIERTYRAVLAGMLDSDATWEAPIDARSARTDVHVVGHDDGLTAVEVRIHTGRTHQIRVHAASAGHAIVGDRRYGGEVGRWAPRLALHAWRLSLRHPKTREPLDLEAAPPADMESLWSRAGAS
jgi:23S rRNA pseudouridine1911/1915/1917 synthase